MRPPANTANQLQTAAASTGPAEVPFTSSVPNRNLAVELESQLTSLAMPLSRLPGTQNTIPPLEHHSQWDTGLMSSRTTGLSSTLASYPACFTNSPKHRADVRSNHLHPQREGTMVVFPPSPSLMVQESLSTTTVSQGNGVPLSSTHVQYPSTNHGSTMETSPSRVKADPPKSIGAMSSTRNLQSGGECCGEGASSGVTHSGRGLEQHTQMTPPQTERVPLADKVINAACTRSEPATPPIPIPARRQWLSLPSATPEQRMSSCDETRKDVRSLQMEDGSVGASRRHVGTQTLYVESVATQTDLNGEERDNTPPTGTVPTKYVLSSSPTLHKGGIDPTALSVGDLYQTAPLHANASDTLEHPPSEQNQTTDKHNCSPQKLDSEDDLLKELLAASFLLNSQEALAVGGPSSSHAHTFNGTSKETNLLTFE